MSLRRVCFVASFFSAVVCTQLNYAQSASESAFEVATIKPTDPNYTGLKGDFVGDNVSLKGFTVKDLVAFAYQVDAKQVINDDLKWVSVDRYDIFGKPEKADPPTMEGIRPMLRTLMADRFKLKVHHETKEMPVFVLTVGKGGSKMKSRTEGDGGEATRMGFQRASGGVGLPGRYVSVKELAEILQVVVLSRPVLDNTGLTGQFDFNLTWRPELDQFHGRGASMAGDSSAPDIFTAIQNQLGLKLTAEKAPADVIVIDNVERPSEN